MLQWNVEHTLITVFSFVDRLLHIFKLPLLLVIMLDL